MQLKAPPRLASHCCLPASHLPPSTSYLPPPTFTPHLPPPASQAASIVEEEPTILTMPEEQLQLRASFFMRVIGGMPSDLARVPHVLTCDLAKLVMLRYAYCLTNGIDIEPITLVVKGDAAFCMQVAGCTLDELNEFEQEGKHLAFFQGAAM